MKSGFYATMVFALVLFTPALVTWAGDNPPENTTGEVSALPGDNESTWNEVEHEVQSRVCEMHKHLEKLHSRLPQLNEHVKLLRGRSTQLKERLEESRARLPELRANVRRAQEQMREKVQAAQERMEASRKSLEESRRKLRDLRPVTPIAVIATADWDKKFKGETAQDEIKKEFPATSDSSLVIRTEFATVDVRAEDRETIFVHAIRKAGGDTQEEARENLEAIDLSVEKRGDQIRITGGLKRKKREDYSGDDYRRIQIDVLLPSYVRGDVKNKFGPVKLNGLETDVAVDNEFGPTVVENTKGELEIGSEFGDTTVSQHVGEGEVRGSFGKLLIDGWSGPLDVKNSYGKMSLSNVAITEDISVSNQFAPISLHLEKDARAKTLTNEITIQNHYSAIAVHLPEAADAEISAKTSWGKIYCDFPVDGKRTGTDLKATLGDGGTPIQITNEFGDIRLSGKNVEVSSGSLISEAPFRMPEMPSIPAIPSTGIEIPEVVIPEISIPEVRIPEISIPPISVSPDREEMETHAEKWTVPLEDVEEIEEVKIRHNHGDITVIGSAEGPYEVRAKKRIWAESKERAQGVADQYSLEVSVSASTLKVESRRPKRSPKGVRGASIDYTLTIPTAWRLQVNADHGDFEARDTRNDIDVEHDHGNVKLTDISGNLTLNCDHGNLHVEDIGGYVEIDHDHGNVVLQNVAGRVICDSDHGKLEIRDLTAGNEVEIEHDHGEVILKNVSGKIRCTNGHADTRLDGVNGPVNVEYEHGNARIVAAEPLEGSWRINSDKGNCYLVLPPKAGVSLSLDTEKGRIKAGWPIEVERDQSRESARVERNGGGTRITITVDHGNINVE